MKTPSSAHRADGAWPRAQNLSRGWHDCDRASAGFAALACDALSVEPLDIAALAGRSAGGTLDLL
jgi:hypothetical protein